MRPNGLDRIDEEQKGMSALTRVPGVERADVSFAEKRADISTKGAIPDALIGAVENAGFRASLCQPHES